MQQLNAASECSNVNAAKTGVELKSVNAWPIADCYPASESLYGLAQRLRVEGLDFEGSARDDDTLKVYGLGFGVWVQGSALALALGYLEGSAGDGDTLLLASAQLEPAFPYHSLQPLRQLLYNGIHCRYLQRVPVSIECVLSV